MFFQKNKTNILIISLFILSVALLGLTTTGIIRMDDPIKLAAAREPQISTISSLSEQKETEVVKVQAEEKQPEEKKEEPKKEEASPSPATPPAEEKKEAVKAEVKTANSGGNNSKYLSKWFNDTTGQMHWDVCNSKDVGRRFIEAFAEFGQDAQVIACVTLNYENGLKDRAKPNYDCFKNYKEAGCVYLTDSISPCWSTNPTKAQLRQCDYASDNTDGGVDAGLFMINTLHQATRITQLGGPSCQLDEISKEISNQGIHPSKHPMFNATRNPSGPCNQQKITWLHDLDNQIKVIKDIYKNNKGFGPWTAYRKHVAPYI